MKRIFWLLAVVILTASGSASRAQELLTNGDFEEGTNGWILSAHSYVTNDNYAYSGTNHLVLSSVSSTTYQPVLETNLQTLTVPADAGRVFVSFQENIHRLSLYTTRTAGMALWLCDSNGNYLSTLFVAFNQTNTDSSQGTYHQHVAEITDFKAATGGQLQLELLSESFGSDSNDVTLFSLDHMSVLAVSNSAAPANDNFAQRSVLSGTATNTALLNLGATLEANEPTNAWGTNVSGGASVWWSYTAPTNGTLVLSTHDSSFNTILAAYTGEALDNLSLSACGADTDASRPGVTLQFPVWKDSTYAIQLAGVNGANGYALLSLNLATDTSAPSLAITNVTGRPVLTTSAFTLQGTAWDNFFLSNVQCRVENSLGTNAYHSAQTTNQWTNWWITLQDLLPGTNTLRACAYDENSNVTTTTCSVLCLFSNRLELATSGQGSVAPGSYSNALLRLSQAYQLKATPAKGWILSNWVDETGAELTNGTTLKFFMRSNLALCANFVPNPFPAVKGTYQGLFIPEAPDDIAFTTAGYFNATMTDKGVLSAQLLLGGSTYSFSGTCSAGGAYSNSLARPGNTALGLSLNVDLQNANVITGLVSSGDWQAPLRAERAVYSKSLPAPQAGNKYTLAIQVAPEANITNAPGDFSIASASVSAAGSISCSGVLSDGTTFSRSATVSASGQWPFYLPLYGGKGALIGWLTLSNQPDTNLVGRLSWFKPISSATLYPTFYLSQELQAYLSRYSYSKTSNVLAITNASLILQDGNLSEVLTNYLSFYPKDVMVITNKGFTFKMTTGNGLFQASVPHALNSRIKALTVHGALLQNQNAGFGNFQGTNQSGSALLLGAPQE